ncbi:MAG: hypothetical protein P8K80_05780 [Phycisphaerales bacterium]|nr:hypothetical protein [Phycisphaerales bacterium]
MADTDSGTSSRPSNERAQHRLMLMKGEHSWQIRWDSGDEDLLVSVVSDLAADEQVEFDWFDAAMVRHQVASVMPPAPEEPE